MGHNWVKQKTDTMIDYPDWECSKCKSVKFGAESTPSPDSTIYIWIGTQWSYGTCDEKLASEVMDS